MLVPSCPEVTTVNLSLENEETLRQLVRIVDFAEGLTLLFARCNIPTLRQRLAEEAIRRLAALEIDVVEVDFAEDASDVRRHLRERLAEIPASRRKTAVFLYGLEHAIPSRDPNPPLLAELNMGRELFHRDAPHPLVFWLPDYALTALARGAPDFWAWRSGVFEFETEPVYREETFQIYAREGAEWLVIDNLTAEQKCRRRTVLESLLADYEALEQDERTQSERADILFTLGQLHQVVGDYAEAHRRYQQSLEIQKKLGNQAGIAFSLHQLGRIAQAQDDHVEARRRYQQSLEIQEKLGNQAGIAFSLHNLGVLAQDQGDFAEARRLYQRSLEIEEKLRGQAGIASSLHQLGRIAHEQGDYAEARRLYQESLEIEEKLGNRAGIAISLGQLGMLAQEEGDYAEARRLYQRSLEIEEKLEDQAGIAGSLNNLGRIAQEQGDHTEARRLYHQSLEIFERLKSPNAEIARRNLVRLEEEMRVGTGGESDT